MNENGKLYFFDVVTRKLVNPDYRVTTPDGKPALPMDCIELNGMVGYCMECKDRYITELEKVLEQVSSWMSQCPCPVQPKPIQPKQKETYEWPNLG